MIQSGHFLEQFKVDDQNRPLKPQMTQSNLIFMVKIGHEMVESAASWESARQLYNGAMLGRHFALCMFSYHLSSLMTFSGFDDLDSAFSLSA